MRNLNKVSKEILRACRDYNLAGTLPGSLHTHALRH